MPVQMPRTVQFGSAKLLIQESFVVQCARLNSIAIIPSESAPWTGGHDPVAGPFDPPRRSAFIFSSHFNSTSGTDGKRNFTHIAPPHDASRCEGIMAACASPVTIQVRQRTRSVTIFMRQCDNR